MRLVFLCILALALAPPAASQGFSTFSGRNHPELDWRVAETERFRIMYPAHLAGIEEEAAPIAEASYEALSSNLGVTFDRKIPIYLSDEDEIVNGFAVAIGQGYTNIWVHQNAVAEVWTGREKWLRKVIAHELAHIFHYRAVLTRPRLLSFLFANPLPRFFTEGLAQYETEDWDAERGDRWLRTAVLDDRLSFSDGQSIWNSRLLYALGNSQVRFFAEQYGDSTLAALLAHRKKALFGLIRVHDFNTAFKAVADTSYRDFYDRWRRHVNVYYNTMAGQMENIDSLDAPRVPLPGQYLYDVRYSPDTSRIAVLSLTSLRIPVRRLYVVDREGRKAKTIAEGSINGPVSWSPDGRQIAFSRTSRGRYGSLLNDLYLVDADGGSPRRITHSRRAASPAFSPDGARLAFIGSEGGTANVFILDLETGVETRHTDFERDVQLAALRWHPSDERLVFARFDERGARDIVVLDLERGSQEAVTPGTHDDRAPVWSPDGSRIAYTSLRDDIPNVFIYDLPTSSHRRVTHMATGASVHDWLPPDSARAAGSLIISSSASKTRDLGFRIDAAREAGGASPEVPAEYAGWTTHRPPAEVPVALEPAPELITARYDYRPLRNITHAASVALPYYGSARDWGVFGFTTWIEPLGKHMLMLFGGLSVPAPRGKSFGVGTYVNNQWYPSLSLSAYRFPGSARLYGNDLLVESFTGGDVSALWPLDWWSRPFVTTSLGARVRYADIEPLESGRFVNGGALPPPRAGQQADLRFTFTHRKQRPYALNVIHPLDGLGLRVQLTGAAPVLGADSRFVRGDVSAFGVFRMPFAPDIHRLYAYTRLQAQTGEPFPQDHIGFSRPDHVQIALPGSDLLTLGEQDRVRGYRSYALGDRVAFGTLEYRMPLLSDLQTRLFGIVTLGAVTMAMFADAGTVWSGDAFGDAERRLGVGVELKNVLRLGRLEVAHALGVAQPAARVGAAEPYDLYYRIRTAVPF